MNADAGTLFDELNSSILKTVDLARELEAKIAETRCLRESERQEERQLERTLVSVQAELKAEMDAKKKFLRKFGGGDVGHWLAQCHNTDADSDDEEDEVDNIL